MSSPEPEPLPKLTAAQRCGECSAPLGHDQRYCVECGTRRGPLPRQAAAAITAILERGRPVQARRGPAAVSERAFALQPEPLSRWMPSPNAAAVAILGMLGFGVLVGSVVGTGGSSLVSSPLLLAVSPQSHLSSSAAGSGGGSPDITVTDSSAAAPAAAGGAAPAAQQAATVFAGTAAPAAGNLAPAPSNLLGLPPIKHVFLIVLSDQGYGQTFGSRDKYFATKLRNQGELIENYYAVTSGPLANTIGLVSGQGPTPQTAQGCPVFANVTPVRKGSLGQVIGQGCVYPSRAQTLADQLSVKKQGGWRAYVEGADQAPRGQLTVCRHPALGAKDSDQAPRVKDPYVTWRNPFVYFHSLIDKAAKSPCAANDVPLTRLAADLKSKGRTAALSYVAASPCDDGDALPCAPKAASGLAAADKFLQKVVPEIERSPAYKADGLIAVTFDQAPQTGPNADPSACCDAQAFPNLPRGTSTTTPTGTAPPGSTPAGSDPTATTPAGGTQTTAPTTTPTTTTPTTTLPPPATTPATGGGQTTPTGGGGRVGLLLISSYVKPGSVDSVDYFNHFSLLATIENIFGLGHLGYAGDLSLPVMDAAVFNAHRP